jgi:cobalt-zinc-cadmium efflux system membrane fusion protein
MLELLWGVWVASRRALLGLFLLGAILGAAWLGYRFPIGSGRGAAESGKAPENVPESISRLDRDTLVVPATVAKRMGLEFAAVKANSLPRFLPPFPGRLAMDPANLTRVRPRFAGEVVDLDVIDDPAAPNGKRPVRRWESVKAGQLLAVVWSKDLGEKKSEFLDAVSKLAVSQDILKKTIDSSNLLPDRNLRDARRAVESDQIALDKARRTLLTWKLEPEEIKRLEAQVKALATDHGTGSLMQDKDWARVEVRAPKDGEILLLGANLGDQVDTTVDMFQVGDLRNMEFWVHVFEEDLPLLQGLGKSIPCTIELATRPGSMLTGNIENISASIDSAQHTALVTGRLNNPDRTLRIGQYLTASVQLQAEKGELEVPTSAVVENGQSSVVFVRSPEHPDRMICRVVKVRHRTQEKIVLRPAGVQSGDEVVVSGALLLREVMETTAVPTGERVAMKE